MSGKLREHEFTRLPSGHQQKINITGLEDFDGLSPEQRHRLLHTPLSPRGLLSMRVDMESHLDKVPLFKLSELLLSEIHAAKTLKLTAKGNLQDVYMNCCTASS